MKRVGVAELKDRLSTHLRAVEAGETVEVTDRGRPIARIVAVERSKSVRIQPARRSFAALRERRYPPLSPPIDVLALLRDERAESAARAIPGE